MAKLWIVYREGLRLIGAVAAEVPLETAIARLDIAPWRLFTAKPPEARRLEEVSDGKRHAAIVRFVQVPKRSGPACGLDDPATGPWDQPGTDTMAGAYKTKGTRFPPRPLTGSGRPATLARAVW